MLKAIFKLRNEINKDAWILLPPSIDGRVQIRVEWYTPKSVKFSYQHEFSYGELTSMGNVALDRFINNANMEIEKHQY